MKNFRSLLVGSTFAMLVLILPARSFGQGLTAGTWTGYMIAPAQERMDVTYEVSVAGDSLTMTLVHEQAGSLPFSNIEVTEDKLTFEWSPGIQLFCDLKLKANGGYEGECAPQGGEKGILVMNPPEEGN